MFFLLSTMLNHQFGSQYVGFFHASESRKSSKSATTKKHPKNPSLCKARLTNWWFQIFFSNLSPYLGTWSKLANVFQMGWNHSQLAKVNAQTFLLKVHSLTLFQKRGRLGPLTNKSPKSASRQIRRKDSRDDWLGKTPRFAWQQGLVPVMMIDGTPHRLWYWGSEDGDDGWWLIESLKRYDIRFVWLVAKWLGLRIFGAHNLNCDMTYINVPTSRI